MTVVDIFMRMEHTQQVTILKRISKTETVEVYKGENQDIPLEYLDYYLYNVKPLDSTTIQLTISR